MTRWTVRGVEPEAILAIQEIAEVTGVGLGEALSAAIRHGAGAALQELEAQDPDFVLVETLEMIQELQHSFGVALRSLYEVTTRRVATGQSKLPNGLVTAD